MAVHIYSERSYQTWPSWHAVYEWEDILAKELECDIVPLRAGFTGKLMRGVRRYAAKGTNLWKKYRFDRTKDIYLLWVMSSSGYRRLPVRNVIPIFLDFPVNTIDDIVTATQELPLFFVTCWDIYSILKNKGLANVEYMPLSVSDIYIYISDVAQAMQKKKIDVIQFGRKNQKLHEFMMKYCGLHPDVEYVYQTKDASLTYMSTTRGNIGKFETRKAYIDLIGSCRVSLVSTPCMDGGRSGYFGDIDFFTARFFESAALFCRMIGRYAENKEAELLGIRDVCPNVEDYDTFSQIMDSYLSEDQDWERQVDFVKKNTTSERSRFIKECLERIQ